MKKMAESIGILASQMNRLKKIPKSKELRLTIREFPRMMEEVVDFIENWLKSWLGAYLVAWDGLTTESLVAAKYVFVAPHKDKAIELRKKLDAFAGNFGRDLLLEIRAEQGLIFVPDIHGPNRLIWIQPSLPMAF